jgi:hypothetical protein
MAQIIPIVAICQHFYALGVEVDFTRIAASRVFLFFQTAHE